MTIVEKTIGPITIGVLLSAFFFGFITMQTYTYFANFPNDRRALKSLVTAVWLVELGHQICITHAYWWLVVENFGKLEVLVTTRLTWSVTGYIFFNGLASLTVCSYFIYRLRRVTGQRVVPIILSILLAARQAGNLALVVYSRKRSSNADLLNNTRPLLIICWTLSATVDVALALALSIDLYMRRREANYRIANVVDRIILWTVATGFSTGMSAVTMLVLFVALPGTNLTWEAIYTPMPRLFALSLLSSLNGRIKIRARDNRASTHGGQVSELVIRKGGTSKVNPEHTVAWDATVSSGDATDSTGSQKFSQTTSSETRKSVAII